MWKTIYTNNIFKVCKFKAKDYLCASKGKTNQITRSNQKMKQPKLVIADASAFPQRLNIETLIRSTKVDTAKAIGRKLTSFNTEILHSAVTVKKAGIIIATIYF